MNVDRLTTLARRLSAVAIAAAMSTSVTGTSCSSTDDSQAARTTTTRPSPPGPPMPPDTSARAQACTSERIEIERALEAYRTKNGRAPTDLIELVPSFLAEEPDSRRWTYQVDSRGAQLLPSGDCVLGIPPQGEDSPTTTT